jgi:hypothetical protein
MTWQPIWYGAYWDLPRYIYTTDGQRAFVLECPFDDELDDYPDRYTVYEAPVLPIPASRREHWSGPPRESLQRLGTVALNHSHLDPTRRAQLDWRALAQWL